MQMSLIELWGHMGWFAKGIVFILAFMSIMSLTVMVQKWWRLRKAQAETRKFAPEFSQFLEEDNLTEAIRLSESYKRSHVARVLGGALGEVKPLIQDGSVTVADINSAERAVERNMLIIIAELKRGLAILATVGATAPFVGLFGTVWGIYHALIRIGASGEASLDAVAAPVGEALIMTAIGLAVAVPAVLGYNFLVRSNRVVIASFDNFAHDLHQYLTTGARVG
jgi:biopolymer transport protein ExbB